MRALKPQNKLNCVIVILLGLILTSTIHSAVAFVLNGYVKYYTPKEQAVNEAILNVFIILFLLSIPIFLIGVLLDSKSKKNTKNFSMIKFIGKFFLYLFVSYYILEILVILFLKYIYLFYPYYFTYIGVSIFLFIIYLFAKMSAKILNSNFFVVFSLLTIILYFMITGGIN